MTGNDYQILAGRTIPENATQESMIQHAVFGLCSEAGEVAGIFQKVYQGHDIDREHLKKEMGDCLWMLAELCTAYDFDLNEIMELNIEKLRKRYPDGFSADRSLHRSEKDI